MPISSGGMGRNSTGPNPAPKYKKSYATKKHKTTSSGVGRKTKIGGKRRGRKKR